MCIMRHRLYTIEFNFYSIHLKTITLFPPPGFKWITSEYNEPIQENLSISFETLICLVCYQTVARSGNKKRTKLKHNQLKQFHVKS